MGWRRGRAGAVPSRRWLNPVLALVYAGWAVAAAGHGQPVLGGIAALVWLELALARFRGLLAIGPPAADQALAGRITPMLRELCGRAGCAVPTLVVRGDVARAAAVRARGRGRALLVLSLPFVARVDDEQLRALLAHEVIHLARNDLAAARRRVRLATLVGAVCGLGAIAAARGGLVDLPIWAAAYLAGMLAGLAALAPANRRREERADLQGASLSGNPAALAEALMQVDAMSRELRARLYGPPLWRWLLAPVSWRMPTHPPLRQRVAALRAMPAPTASAR